MCGTIDNVHFLPYNQSYAARRACIEFEVSTSYIPGCFLSLYQETCFYASVFFQDPEGASKALELDGIEIKGKPIKVFSSLEEWDQHIASFKDAQKQSQENVKEGEGEGDGEADKEIEQDVDGANGDAEMEDGQVSNFS